MQSLSSTSLVDQLTQYVSRVSVFHVSDSGKVLHLLAIARAADVPLTIDDFQEISDRTPYIADLKYAFNRVCKVP